MTTAMESAFGHDLELCAVGMVATNGKLRRRYVAQHRAIMGEIKAMNKAEGLDTMSDDELLAELLA